LDVCRCNYQSATNELFDYLRQNKPVLAVKVTSKQKGHQMFYSVEVDLAGSRLRSSASVARLVYLIGMIKEEGIVKLEESDVKFKEINERNGVLSRFKKYSHELKLLVLAKVKTRPFGNVVFRPESNNFSRTGFYEAMADRLVKYLAGCEETGHAKVDLHYKHGKSLIYVEPSKAGRLVQTIQKEM